MRNVFHLSWLETSDAGRPFSADIHFPFERSSKKKRKRQNAKSDSKLGRTKHLNDLFSGDSWRPSKWSLDQMKLSFCWFTENYEFIGQSSANNVLIYYYPIQCDRCAANVKWVFVFCRALKLMVNAYAWKGCAAKFETIEIYVKSRERRPFAYLRNWICLKSNLSTCCHRWQ